MTVNVTSGSVYKGFVVVTELKVMSVNDKSPLGFLPLVHTMDDSESDHPLTLPPPPAWHPN